MKKKSKKKRVSKELEEMIVNGELEKEGEPKGRIVEIKAEALKKMKSQIYHDELPKHLVDRVTKLFPVIKTLFSDYSIEDWVNGFKYDVNPETEIAYWEEMVSKFQDRVGDLQISPEETQDIWNRILNEMDKIHPIVIKKDGEIPFA